MMVAAAYGAECVVITDIDDNKVFMWGRMCLCELLISNHMPMTGQLCFAAENCRREQAGTEINTKEMDTLQAAACIREACGGMVRQL